MYGCKNNKFPVTDKENGGKICKVQKIPIFRILALSHSWQILSTVLSLILLYAVLQLGNTDYGSCPMLCCPCHLYKTS